MKRILAASLLLASGAAAAQSGIVLTTGPGNVSSPGVVVIPPPDPGDFGPVFIEPPRPVHTTSLDGLATAWASNKPPPCAPNPATMLLGEQPILTIEEDGVRLPDERLDTVLH